jgi:hypothetical protein
VPGLTASDLGSDPAGADETAVLVVVVAAVGEQPFRPVPWSADAATHARDRVEQGQQLSDVVAVGRSRRPGQQQPTAVGQDVVFDACPATVDRTRAKTGAPFFACT